MGDIFEVLSQVATVMEGINSNKVANFSYTNTAYTADEVDGVASYDYTQEQNIPLPDNTDLEQSVRDKGIRSQGASLPRNAINHFFGRVSYNLNKITDMVISLITGFASSMATNANQYSPTAEYKQGDTCYVNVLFDGTNTRMQLYQRVTASPETIQGVYPPTNAENWEPVYSAFAANVVQATNNTTIANTAFVHAAIDAYDSAVATALAGKAPTVHSSSDSTYGAATIALYGHIKLADTNTNSTTLVPTSSVLYTVNQALVNALAGKAPTDHSSSDSTYGAATTALYGHVKLSNIISDSTELVPTCAAVNNALATGHAIGEPFPVFGVTISSPLFVECNGQKINDVESATFHNKRIPNLNGGSVILTATFTADAGGSYATIPIADIPALALHDWVAGVGIASHSWIKAIDYSTGVIIISDIATSGSITTTFTNEGRGIIGGEFGSVGDQKQRLTGTVGNSSSEHNFVNLSAGALYVEDIASRKIASPSANTYAGWGRKISLDTSLSPYARTSADTWGKTKTDAYRMKYYMRIK